MSPKLFILVTLTDGAKTADEIKKILEETPEFWSASMHLNDYTGALLVPSPDGDRTTPTIRQLADGRFELTTEGHVWLSRHPTIRFIVDRMNALQAHGLSRSESIPAPTLPRD